MKTLNDYMAMNYRMEIIEDREEGGYVVCIQNFRDVLHVVKLLSQQ